MNIDELLKRPSPQIYTVDEAKFIVEKYIEKKKGVKVDINVFKKTGYPTEDMNPFGIFVLQTEFRNLWEAMLIASERYYDN